MLLSNLHKYIFTLLLSIMCYYACINSYLTFIYSDNSYHTEEKRRLLEQMETKYDYTSSKLGEPTYEYQHLVRRIRSNTNELWNLVNSELKHLQKSIRSGDKSTEQLKIIDHLLDLGLENKMSLDNDMNEMMRNDNYENWRHKESQDLSDLVQRRLEYLQNPEDCNTAKKLICRLNKVNSILNKLKININLLITGGVM